MDTHDSTTPTKRCTKCGNEFPATSEFFHRSKGNKDGLRGDCVNCSRAAHRKWYEANREHRASYNRTYRESHREYFASYMKEWGERNKEHKAATYKAWCLANPHRSRARGHRYRSIKRGIPSTLSIVDWQAALDYFKGCCAVCGRPPGLWHTVSADHWIPVTDPNCPGTVPWNIVPLCHDKKHGSGGCNNSKYNLNAADWLTRKFGKRKGQLILKQIETFLDSRRSKGEDD